MSPTRLHDGPYGAPPCPLNRKIVKKSWRRVVEVLETSHIWTGTWQSCLVLDRAGLGVEQNLWSRCWPLLLSNLEDNVGLSPESTKYTEWRGLILFIWWQHAQSKIWTRLDLAASEASLQKIELSSIMLAFKETKMSNQLIVSFVTSVEPVLRQCLLVCLNWFEVVC